jgi:hypothetical protein
MSNGEMFTHYWKIFFSYHKYLFISNMPALIFIPILLTTNFQAFKMFNFIMIIVEPVNLKK